MVRKLSPPELGMVFNQTTGLVSSCFDIPELIHQSNDLKFPESAEKAKEKLKLAEELFRSSFDWLKDRFEEVGLKHGIGWKEN